MRLIAPDVLAEARGLTSAMSGTLCVLGVALWLFGWRWHRFWIVSGITLAAGLLGLNAGRAAGGTQIMAVGILLAVAAGMMALELAKVFAFVAGGCGAWLAVQWVFPNAQELLGRLPLRRPLRTAPLPPLDDASHQPCRVCYSPVMPGCCLSKKRSTSTRLQVWVTANQAAMSGVAVGLIVLGILLQAVATPEDTGGVKLEKKEKKR